MNLSKTALIMATCLMITFESVADINHEVQRSETLWGIAHKYKVSPDDIIKANPEAGRGIKAGMILRIPTPDQQSAADVIKPQDNVPDAAVPEVEEVYVQEAVNVPEAVVETTPTPAPTPVPSNPTPPPYVKPVDTKKYGENVYVARFGDNLFSISQKTLISVADLLAYNPLVDPENIPEGYIVRLSKDAPYVITDSSVSLVDSIIYKLQPQPAPKSTAAQTDTKVIALMLPFDIENEVISRQSLLATDFYKGFLVALKHATGNGSLPVKVLAIDSQCDSLTFNHRLDQLVQNDVTIVIPPEDEAQLDRVQQYALEHHILVLNSLNVKDEGYQRYPNVLQCNISQKLMYEKAIQALLNDFDAYTPVILNIHGAKEEKSQFVDDLRQSFRDAGREVIDLSVNNRLLEEDLMQLSPTKKYIFIPKSGSADVFNKFSETLVEAIENNPIDRRYKVFGYPDWITFRGEQEEMLHRLGAYIYSRFYMDETNPSTRDVINEYIRWYGYQMEDVYPSQGMLGYDVGTMVFEALKKKWPENDFNKFESGTYSGEQSTFHFVKGESAQGVIPGLINDSLYIIEYLPATGVYVKAI